MRAELDKPEEGRVMNATDGDTCVLRTQGLRKDYGKN
jgi:hypothetical protein